EEIERFLYDLDRLRKIFDNGTIAEVLGIHPSNLSSYRSRKKKPGKETISKFYEAFGEKLNSLGGKPYDSSSAGSDQQKAEDPPGTYTPANVADDITNKLVNTLIANNEKLWKNNERLWEDKEKTWANDKKIIHGLLRNSTVLSSKIAPRRGFSGNSSDPE
ncbi:hypothetical protein, partial [Puia sp.]|uniref:hypothetical protein n=1 Tax=Puia sp. TaxID=2045100 RepID=UPI002F3FA0FF